MLADLKCAHGAIDHRAGGQAENAYHASQTPVRRFFGVAGAVRGELLGNVTEGTSAISAAVHQTDGQIEAFRLLECASGVVGGVAKSVAAHFQGQTLASITKRSGGFGTELAGEGFARTAEAVGAASQSVFQDMA